MMNTTSHLIAATALFALTLVIHILIRNDTNTRPLDTARYYTLVREKGDVSLARSYLDSENTWLSQPCRGAINVTDRTNNCVVERRNLRDSILNAMKCMAYSSQVCSYLRNITSGLIQNRTYGVTSYAVGRSLVGTVQGQGALTYRQLLQNSLDNAPLLFHNSFRAAQSEDFYVLRTGLYNLIVFTIIANLLVHYFDQEQMSWTKRLIMRILVFLLATLVANFFFLINYWGSALTLLGGIWAPALIVLFYFEAFLDDSITRPW
jgi:hypothetical protein